MTCDAVLARVDALVKGIEADVGTLTTSTIKGAEVTAATVSAILDRVDQLAALAKGHAMTYDPARLDAVLEATLRGTEPFTRQRVREHLEMELGTDEAWTAEDVTQALKSFRVFAGEDVFLGLEDQSAVRVEEYASVARQIVEGVQ